MYFDILMTNLKCRCNGREVPNVRLRSRISYQPGVDKELKAYLADLDELNPWRLYKIIAGSIASLFEHEIKIERGSHVRTAEIRGCTGLQSIRDYCLPCTLIYLRGLLFSLFDLTTTLMLLFGILLKHCLFSSDLPMSR